MNLSSTKESPLVLSAVGLDIMPLSRLSRVLTRSPNLFRSLCHEDEHAELCSPMDDGLLWAAMLWTCKEATAKCLGTGFWRQGVEWSEVKISPQKMPKLSLLVSPTNRETEPTLSPKADKFSTVILPVDVSLFCSAAALMGEVQIRGTFELIFPNDEVIEDNFMSMIALSHMGLYR